MDHPLRSSENKVLRGRVVHLLKNGFTILRQSNIVFVCGGNKDTDMRSGFQKIFQEQLPGYDFFKPEFAMENYFSSNDTEPFDIADFEMLIGDLSIAIVLFPEAPGSFAELGYFSGQSSLVGKIVLALDSNHQRTGSFISLGPASKVAKISKFGLPIQLNYKQPDFSLVSTRITEHAKLKQTRRQFVAEEFANLDSFELFALIHRVVEILVIATGEDIESLLRSMFDSHVTPSTIKKIISILIGSGRLKEVGEFGHFIVCSDKPQALLLQDGFKTELMELTVGISAILYTPNAGVTPVLEALG